MPNNWGARWLSNWLACLMRSELPASKSPIYVHLLPGSVLPSIEQQPSKIIVVVQDAVTEEWQNKVSDWIVNSGCLCMMAWGDRCSTWDDSVDWANLSQHDFGEVPDDKFVMTSWHEDEPLEEAFWFSKFCASHPTIALDRVIILHISNKNRETEILKSYQCAMSDEYLEKNP